MGVGVTELESVEVRSSDVWLFLEPLPLSVWSSLLVVGDADLELELLSFPPPRTSPTADATPPTTSGTSPLRPDAEGELSSEEVGLASLLLLVEDSVDAESEDLSVFLESLLSDDEVGEALESLELDEFLLDGEEEEEEDEGSMEESSVDEWRSFSRPRRRFPAGPPRILAISALSRRFRLNR